MTDPYPRPDQSGTRPAMVEGTARPTTGHPTQQTSSGPSPSAPTGSAGPTWWPPPTEPPGFPPPPPPGGPTRPPRQIVRNVALIGVALAAVALTLVFTVGGGHRTVAGQATPQKDRRTVAQSDPDTVAQTFLRLETARYNATPTPNPTRTVYSAVSCHADLAQMSAGTPGAAQPPISAKQRYSFEIDSISPLKDGRQLLRITRTDNTSGDQGDGLFYEQKESGAWKVCGLFDSTQPPPDAGDGSGGTGPTGTPPPATGNDPGAGSGGGQSISDPHSFLASFTQAVHADLIGTAASAICINAPQLDTTVLSWARAHAQVSLQSLDTSGLPSGASARVQVSPSGQKAATYGLVLTQQPSGWCIEDVQQL